MMMRDLREKGQGAIELLFGAAVILSLIAYVAYITARESIDLKDAVNQTVRAWRGWALERLGQRGQVAIEDLLLVGVIFALIAVATYYAQHGSLRISESIRETVDAWRRALVAK